MWYSWFSGQTLKKVLSFTRVSELDFVVTGAVEGLLPEKAAAGLPAGPPDGTVLGEEPRKERAPSGKPSLVYCRSRLLVS